jgi:hypothetical protein
MECDLVDMIYEMLLIYKSRDTAPGAIHGV